MSVGDFLKDPLRGKASLGRVFWLYGVLGSLLYGAAGLMLDPGNVWLMRLYSMGGTLLTAYVIIATYRCAANTKSRALEKFIRVSCVISLLLLPLIAYWELSGSLSLDSLLGQEF